MRTLYVGGLPEEFDEPSFEALFASYDGVTSLRLAMRQGECRGFGYVTFADDEDATRAQAVLDGARLAVPVHGETRLRVAFAS
jgi:RNA recognition motif-containing protein